MEILFIISTLLCVIILIYALTKDKSIFSWYGLVYIVSSIISFISYSEMECKNFNPEYEIELVDQNTVKIKALDSDKIYTCKPEQCDSIFDIDNL